MSCRELVCYIAAPHVSAYLNFYSQMFLFHNDALNYKWNIKGIYHQIGQYHQSDSRQKPIS